MLQITLKFIFMDESMGVILFICAPLLLLLIAVLVLRVKLTLGTAITLPTFSLDVSNLGHGVIYVTYRDEHAKLHFDGEIGRGKRFFVPRVYLRVPEDMPQEEVWKVVPALTLALGKLGYEYVIYKPLGKQLIPQQKRDEATEELRRIGIEIDRSQDHLQITKTSLPYWRRVFGSQGKVTTEQLLRHLAAVRGTRERVEVLARNE